MNPAATPSRRKALHLGTALATTLASFGLAAAPAYGQAETVLPTITAGNEGGATITPQLEVGDAAPGPSTMTVNLNNASRIINWDTYNVGAGYGVSYTSANTSTQYGVLNRVMGANFSNIEGAITSQANIAVWLSNPNGIVFGSTGSFNGGSLVLTTLGVTDADFNDGGSANLSGVSSAGVNLNDGSSLTSSGSIVIAAQAASIAGDLSAGGDIALVAARDVTFTTGIGSPLALQITAGTTVSGIQVSGTAAISADSIGLVAVDDSVVMNTLLAVNTGAALTATAANGVVVLATDDYSGGGISIAVPETGDAIVSSGTLAATGSGGDVVVSAAGNATLSGTATANDDLTATAANVTLNAATLTAQNGDLAVTGPVTVTGANVLAGGTVTVNAAVNASAPGAGSLTVNSPGATTFNSSIGATAGLSSLATNAGGTTVLNGGGGVTTVGTQSYGDNLVLGAAQTLTSTVGGAISLLGTLNGAFAFEVNTAGLTSFGGSVGGTTPLASVRTGGGGTTLISGGSITTTGLQNYNDVVQLGANTDLVSTGGGSLSVAGANGAFNLSLETGGAVSAGQLGGTTPLTGLALRANTASLAGVSSIGTLAADIGSGGFNFYNSQTLTVGTVDGLSGVNAPGAVTIATFAGNLVVNAPVESTTAAVSLTGQGGLTGSAGGTVTSAAGVDLEAQTGSIALAGAITAADDVTATAPGSVTLGAVSSTGGDISVASPGNVSLTGAASGVDIALSSDGAVSTAALTARDDIAIRATGSATTGALTSGSAPAVDVAGAADALVGAQAGNDIDIAANGIVVGATRANGAGSDVRLDGGAAGIGNGAVDLDIGAGAAIALTGNARGRDIQLSSATVTAANLTARDDIAIRASGAAAVGNLTSGATVDALGPVNVAGAADALVGTALPGQDIDIAANGLTFGVVRANGAGSDVRLVNSAGSIGNGAQDLDIVAGGNIAIGDAGGLDIALSAGGTVTTGALSARDDIAIRATGAATTGDLTSGTTVDALAPTDGTGAADTLVGALPGNDIDVAANGLMVGLVRATGTGSDVQLAAGPVGLGDGSQDLDVAADGDIALGNARGRDIALNAGGALTTGALVARDDIALRAVGSANVGSLTSGTTIGAFAPTDVAGAADSLLGAAAVGNDIDGQATGLTVGAAIANGAGSDVRLASAGATSDLIITAAISAGTDVTLTAGRDATVGSIVTAGGGYTVQAGRNVTLGNGTAVTQSAGGLVNIVATAGDITGLAGLTLRSNSALANDELAGSLNLDAASGTIAFALDSTVDARQAFIGIREGAGTNLSLGDVTAVALINLITAGGTYSAPLMVDGDFTARDITLQDSLWATIGGDFRASSVDVTGPASVLGDDITLSVGGDITGLALGSPDTANSDPNFGRIDLSADVISVTVAGLAQLGAVTADTNITVTAGSGSSDGSIDVTSATATSGNLALTARASGPAGDAAHDGDILVGFGSAGGTADLDNSGGDIGDVAIADRLLAGAGIDVDSADDVAIAQYTGPSGFLRSTTGAITIDAQGSVHAIGGSETALAATARGIDTLAGTGNLVVTSSGDARIGSADAAGNLGLNVSGSLTGTNGGTTAVTGGALFAEGAGGAVTVNAGSAPGTDIASFDTVRATGDIAITADLIGVGTLSSISGSLALTGAHFLNEVTVGGPTVSLTDAEGNGISAISLVAADSAGLEIFTTAYGSTDLTSDGGLNAVVGRAAQLDTVQADTIALTAGALAAGEVTSTAGAANLRATTGTLSLVEADASGSLTLTKQGGSAATAGNELRVGTAIAGGPGAGTATLDSSTHVRAGSVTAQGDITLRARTGDATGVRGASTGTSDTAYGRANVTANGAGADVTVTGDGLVQLGAATAGANLTVTAGSAARDGSIDVTSATATSGDLALTARAGSPAANAAHDGDILLGFASAGGTAALGNTGGNIGDIVIADRLLAGSGIDIDSSDDLVTAQYNGTTGFLRAEDGAITIDVRGSIHAVGGSETALAATARGIETLVGTGDLIVTSSGDARIGSVDVAGDLSFDIAGSLTGTNGGTTAVTGGALFAEGAGGSITVSTWLGAEATPDVASFDTVRASGDISIASDQIGVNTISSATGSLALTGAHVVGSATVAGTIGGPNVILTDAEGTPIDAIDLVTADAGGLDTFDSGYGSTDLAADGTLTAVIGEAAQLDTVTAGGLIDVEAAAIAAGVVTSTGGIDLLADTGTLALETADAGGALTLVKQAGSAATAGDELRVGTATADGTASLDSSTHVRADGVTAQGDLTLLARTGDATGTLGASTDTSDADYGRAELAAGAAGAALSVTADGLAQLGAVTADSDVTVSAGNYAGSGAGGSIDVLSATATNGNLAFSATATGPAGDAARDGDILLGTGMAGGTATVSNVSGGGDIGNVTISTSLTAGLAVQIDAAQDANLAPVTSSAGTVAVRARGDVAGFTPATGATFAAGEDVAVTAGGSVSLATATAGDDIWVSSTGPITASGALTATGAGPDGAAADFSDTQTIASGTEAGSGSNIELVSAATIGTAELTAAGSVTIDGNGVTVSGATEATTGSVAVSGGPSVTMDDIIAGRSVSVSAGTVGVGDVEAGTTVALTADTGTASAGSIEAGGDALISAARDATVSGNVAAGGDLAVDAGRAATLSGNVSAGGGATVTAGSAATLSGNVSAGGDATVRAGSASTLSGNLSAGGDATVTAGSAATLSGNLSAGGDATVTAGSTATLAGNTVAGGDLAVTARQAARIAGNVTAGADYRVTGRSIELGGTGAVTQQADGAVSLTANAGDVTQGAGRLSLIANSDGAGTEALTIDAADGAITLGNAALQGGTLSGRQSDVSLAARSITVGRIDGASLRARAATGFAANEAIVAGNSARASDPAGGRSTVDIAVSNGAISLGNATARGAGHDILLSASGAITANNLTAARSVSVDGNGVIVRGSTVATTGDVDIAGGASATLGNITAGRSVGIGARTVSTGSVVAGTSATLTASSGPLTAASVDAGTDAALSATGDVEVAGALAAGNDATVNSGGDTAIGGNIAAGRDFGVAAGGAVALAGTVTAGRDLAVVSTGAAVLNGNVTAGRDYRVTGSSIELGGAGAVTQQAGGAVALTANSADVAQGAGRLTVIADSDGAGGEALTIAAANGAVALGNAGLQAGSIEISGQTVTVDAAAAASALTIDATVGALDLGSATAGGAVALSAATRATLGAIGAGGQTVTITAADADIDGTVTAGTIRVVDRGAAGNPLVVGDDTGVTGGFALSSTEVNRLNAATVTLDAGTGAGVAQNVAFGNLALDADTGGTAFNVLGTQRIDLTGELSASGSGARSIQLGGTDGSGTAGASVLRVAATADGGGRITVPGVNLILRADTIGVGQDAGFLDALGVSGDTPLDRDAVATQFVGNSLSSLYHANRGGVLYTRPDLITAASLTVRYSNFALFQNTGLAPINSGVTLEAAPGATALDLNGLGAQGGPFALFGTINGSRDEASAVQGEPVIRFTAAPSIDFTAARVNGCLIGSGSGCIGLNINPNQLPPLDPIRDQLIDRSDTFEIPFDPVVGTNNESLFGDVGSFGLSDLPLELLECDPNEGGECATAESDQQ